MNEKNNFLPQCAKCTCAYCKDCNIAATKLQLQTIHKYMKKGYLKKDLETVGNLTRIEASNLIMQAHGIMRMRFEDGRFIG